jgi:Zn finger protein HypA/HybF involved in hydrogenase expression
LEQQFGPHGIENGLPRGGYSVDFKVFVHDQENIESVWIYLGVSASPAEKSLPCLSENCECRVDNGGMPEPEHDAAEFYCPACAQPVAEPLVCGDCHALICRQCGTPLERIDELGIG